MQVIPDKLDITTGQHVFETPEDIVINSQIYEKITMEPKPYNFFNMNTVLTNKNLLLHEVNILEYSDSNPFKEPGYEYYIQDNQNPDLFYCLSEIGPTNTNQYVHKIQKQENGWKVISSISPDSSYRPVDVSGYQGTYLHYKLLGQTQNYIILCQEQTGANNFNFIGFFGPSSYTRNNIIYHTHSYIAINKNNFATKILNVANNSYDLGVFKIKETDDSIYCMENLSGMIKIIRYNPETNVRTEFYSNNSYGNTASCIGISNIIEFQNNYYVLIGNSDYKFLKITIDFEYNKITATVKTLPTCNGFTYHNATNRTDFLDCHWIKYSLKNIDDKYICITSHDNQNARHLYGYTPGIFYYFSGTDGYYNALDKLTFSNLKWHRHVLLKYNEEDDSWSNKGIIEPDEQTQHIYGVLYYDQYTPIFFMNNKLLGYRLNLETEKYEKCFEKAGTFYTIGLDENNKFYTFDNANNCNIYNDVTSFELSADFEKPNYTYNNTDIDTYVTIYSKNFVNNYIKTKVEVTLDGSCKFTSNGKKKLITYTDPNGKLNIPVTVYYGGTVYCYIKEVE